MVTIFVLSNINAYNKGIHFGANKQAELAIESSLVALYNLLENHNFKEEEIEAMLDEFRNENIYFLKKKFNL